MRLINRDKIQYLDDERSIGNGIILTLKPGWQFDIEPFDNAGCHVAGGENMKELNEYLKNIKPCKCVRCSMH